MEFSTKDKDNDKSSKQCAREKKGGWWYKDCSESNLTGQYLYGKTTKKSGGMTWNSWRGDKYSLEIVRMMVRQHGVDVHVKP